jgi:hypothetical protein
MDKFESTMADWSKLSDSEKRTEEENKRGRCICPGCPSYADCAMRNKELMFCFASRSSCIKTSKGCHCPGCPVRADFGLTNIYYCLNGTEQEIRNG